VTIATIAATTKPARRPPKSLGSTTPSEISSSAARRKDTARRGISLPTTNRSSLEHHEMVLVPESRRRSVAQAGRDPCSAGALATAMGASYSDDLYATSR
jgi:hypothetical protein